MHHQTTLTTMGAEKLRAQFERLKERYDHITQDLRNKTQSHVILAMESIEREAIFSDMAKMKAILSRATIVKKAGRPTQAEQGTKVTYIQRGTGEKHTVTLVDPLEADPFEGFVSVKSPVGSMLLGRQVGESTRITTPKGILHLTIVELL